MFHIHSNKDSEGVREALRRLVADNDRATMQINGNTFSLYPKPTRSGVPIKFYGCIVQDRDGSLIQVWSLPHWSLVIFFPFWVLLCWQLLHAPLWFIIMGLIVGVISFIVETRRGYGLLREYVT